MQNPQSEKKRHGCLTSLLAVICFVSVIATLLQFTVFFFKPEPDVQDVQSLSTTSEPRWLFFTLAAVNLIKLVSAYAILSWKKWGFWLFTLICFVNLGVNLITGFHIPNGILGIIIAAILFGVLQIGGDKKGWNQLD